MLIRPCAPPNNRASRKRPGFLALLLLVGVLLAGAAPARSEETIIVSATLNRQPQGDLFVILRDNGDFLLTVEDLEEMGFQHLPGDRISRDGATFISLPSIPGLDFHFDEATLALDLDAPPELLSKSVLDLAPARHAAVLYPRDDSLFLNYGIDYSAGGENLDYEGVTIVNEFGGRLGDWLVLTDSLYRNTPDENRFVRLNTSLVRDDRSTMRRLTAGDFFAFSGDLGRRVQIGGVGLSKIYGIDPYFIHYPLFGFSGLLSLPAEVEVLVDGRRVQSRRFSPGEFELQNFESLGGAQTVEVVIRDVLGREQRIHSPYYFTDKVLRRGLHEYSYNLGFLRRDFGLASNRYGRPVASAFHRYGVTDQINLGFRGEAASNLINGGLESQLLSRRFGLTTIQIATSGASAGVGLAGQVRYEFQNRAFRARLAVETYSRGYRTLDDPDREGRRRHNLLTGIGYLHRTLGSFALDFFHSDRYGGPDQSTLTASWSRRVWRGAYLNATLRQVRDDGTAYEGALSLTWYLGQRDSVTTAVRHENGADLQVIEARRSTPIGAGTGGALRGEHSSRDDGHHYLFDTFIQHNARHAVLMGEYSHGSSPVLATDDLRLSVSGALVHIGGETSLTRPVTDSFGLVTVGQVEGVRVYMDNQLAGTTNENGRVFLPELSSYYDNLVAIDDRDIPLDFLMPAVKRYISPPLRSGSCITFPLQRYQAFTGTLLLQSAEGRQPLAYAEVELATAKGPLVFWTGGDGGFYFDQEQFAAPAPVSQGCGDSTDAPSLLSSGNYRAVIRRDEKAFRAEITLPPSDAPMVELGEIILTDDPATPAEDVAAKEK